MYTPWLNFDLSALFGKENNHIHMELKEVDGWKRGGMKEEEKKG